MSNTAPSPESTKTTTYDLLELSSQAILDFQREDGSFPPGQNDVYNEPETPVRTTSHWLTTLTHVYEFSGKNKYADAANKAADYLLTQEARPYWQTFHSRNAKTKCDGLVGQGRPTRSLARAGSVLDRNELISAALEVFCIHPFDYNIGLWEAVEIDGTKTFFDRTLNHQIIFAAQCSELITHSDLVRDRIECFLDNLENIMRTHPDGMVQHYIRPPIHQIIKTTLNCPKHWPLVWNEIISQYYRHSDERKMKELGYHSTLLAPMAKLKEEFDDHPVWKSTPIKSAIEFTNSNKYINQIRNEESSYSSMLPGVNHARILRTFHNASIDEIRPWVEMDVNRKFDTDSGLFSQNSVDPQFQASSISVLTELPNIEIQSTID